MAPSATDFEALALRAFARIPEPFARHLEGIRVTIAEFADEETLAALGLETAWELTGLYHGRSLAEGDSFAPGELPPVITLYRQPLLAEWCETGVTLENLIAHVVIHEVGHHFGLSDAQMHALEDEAR
ncbi:metallopeptidase family protein [Novosphingobium aquimarinum]|uniref:metallopeptidase family protein n=1 Tax=Novosphingobium aquimarinum TaxID=2682494 RepID=UPI001E3C4AAC|nr:metallopeptidase family protein [Novosphingobium aquimarinum]